MKKLLTTLCLLTAGLFGQTTVVQDTIRDQNLQPFSGTVSMEWPNYTSGASTVAGGHATIPIVGGRFRQALAPTPAGVYYTITYIAGPYSPSPQHWSIPVSAIPVTISSILVTVPVSSDLVIDPSQISTTGAANGNALVYNSGSGRYGPAAVASAGCPACLQAASNLSDLANAATARTNLGAQAALGFTPENVANKDTSTALGTSDTAYPSQKAVKTYTDAGLAGKQPTIGYTPENAANKATSTALGTSDTAYPSQNAVKSYVDTGLAGKQATIGFTPENVANKDTSTALGASDTAYPSQNAVKSYVDTGLAGKQATIGFTPENAANKDTSTALGASDTAYPSQNAVKSYVDTGLATKQNSLGFTPENSANKGAASGYAPLDGSSLLPQANVPGGIAATKIGTSTVDNTEFSYLDGVTSNLQTQLGGKQASLGFTPLNPANSLRDLTYPGASAATLLVNDLTAWARVTNWTAYPPSELNQWNDIAWSPTLNLFAAVSQNGTNRVMTSPNGITWTARVAAEADPWQAITWVPSPVSLFVAVANTGTNRVMTSPDGINWTSRSIAASGWASKPVWSPSLSLLVVVAISGTNRVATSPDGITWTSRSASQANAWIGAAWSSSLSLFVAVSNTGTNRVMTSPDGINWTNQNASSAAPWQDVKWSPQLGLFCAVSGNSTAIMTSPDGTTWTARTGAISGWKLAWSPDLGLFAVIGQSGTATARIETSPDGITWTTRTNPAIGQITGVDWAPALGVFGAVSFDGTVNRAIISYSSVGTTSIPFPTSAPLTVADNLASVSNATTAGANIGALQEVWRARTAPQANYWAGITWAPKLGIFAAVSNDGTNRVATSPDGVTWTNQTAASAASWQTITWANSLGIFVALSTDGAVMTSPDGSTWTTRTPATAGGVWTTVTWSPALSLFLAASYSGGGSLMTSPDGITWTNRTASQSSNWLASTWSSDLSLFVVAGQSATGMTSPDGVTWTNITFPADPGGRTTTWQGATWSSEVGLFVLVGYSSGGSTGIAPYPIATSPDGITWTLRDTALSTDRGAGWISVVWASTRSLFVAVAGGGFFGGNSSTNSIMESTDGINWTRRSIGNIGFSGVAFSANRGTFVAIGTIGSNRVWTSQGSQIAASLPAQHHIVARLSSATTIAAGAGAGGSPTVTLTSGSNDIDGQVSVAAGTLPSTSAVISTVTFDNAYTSTGSGSGVPFCVLYPANLNAATLSGTSMTFVSATSTTFSINAGSVGLAGATTYLWNYHCAI